MRGTVARVLNAFWARWSGNRRVSRRAFKRQWHEMTARQRCERLRTFRAQIDRQKTMQPQQKERAGG